MTVTSLRLLDNSKIMLEERLGIDFSGDTVRLGIAFSAPESLSERLRAGKLHFNALGFRHAQRLVENKGGGERVVKKKTRLLPKPFSGHVGN